MRYVNLIVCTLFLVLGCQKNEPAPARGITAQEQSASMLQENQTMFVDQGLTEQVRIVDYKVSRNDMGMLVVALQLQTSVDEDVAVDAKCRFIHKTGKIEETPWQPWVLRRHEMIPVTFTSLAPEADRYNVYVRFSK